MINFISEGCVRSIQAATIWNMENTSECVFWIHPLKLEQKQASDVVRQCTHYVPEEQLKKTLLP
jgi:hypothetical protein